MKRLALVVSALFLFVSSVRAGKMTITAVAHDGRTATADVVAGETVDLIVEFRDAPLFAREKSRIATASARASRHAVLQSRFAQFTNDVAGMQITHTYERVFAGASVTVSRQTAAAIEKLSYVAKVFPDRTVEALEAGRTVDATLADSVARIKADQVWSTYGTRGSGVVVAVLDTGIDYKHAALGGGFGPGTRVIGGWDFINKDADPLDDQGHGTHVAGIIGGNGGGLTGVAPDVSFLAYKVLDSRGSGKDSDVIAGVERAADPNQDGDPSDHADVANMSLGGPGTADDPLPRAVETATAAGVLFVIAAGNSGGFYTVGAPAVAPSALAVGASDVSDVMASFSSGGPSITSLAIKPEVVAPGVSIVSAAMGGGTVAKSGTSMATPHVAGAAALLKAIHREWTPAEIKSALASTAETLKADVMAQGGGRIDALRAAGAEVLPDPDVVSFGRATTDVESWTSSGEIRLTNRGASPVSLTGSATGSTEAIAAALDPASVTIAPGETQTVHLAVTVTHALLPYPRQGSLALSGQVVFTGTTTLHVPWAFVKALRLSVSYDKNDFLTTIVAPKRSLGVRTVTRNGQGHIDVYEPPGDYDVLMSAVALNGMETELRTLFAARQTISTDTNVAFSSTAPVTSIVYSSKDEKGGVLADIGREPGRCLNSFLVVFPADSELMFTGAVTSNNEGRPFRMLVNSPPENMTLTGSQVCWDGVSALHIAQLGNIPTSSPSVDAAVDEGSWRHVPLGMVAPSGLQNQVLQFGAATLEKNLPAVIPLPEYATIPMTETAWRGTLYITPERHERFGTSAWLRLTSATQAAPAAAAVDVRTIRSTEAGIVLSPYRTIGPATYVSRAGDPLNFGAGLAHPESTIFVDSGVLRTFFGWVGSLDETRTVEARTEVVSVRDSSGNVLTSAPLVPSFALPAAGAYTIEMTQMQTIAGFGSETRLTTGIDTTRSDTAAPSLRCVRILDSAGRPAEILAPFAYGRLRFAALDLVFDAAQRTGSSALVVPEKTTVRWRQHGSAQWQDLPFTVEAQDIANSREEFDLLGHVPAGVVFGCDLSPVTTTASGPVDVQVHVEDAGGNSLEYVAAPAFVVGGGKRRAVGR